jgi:hypothetical protein
MKQLTFPLDLPEPPRSSLSTSTQPLMRLMLEMGLNKDAIATLLEIAQFPLAHVRWMAGPLVVRQSQWAETLPQWLIRAAYIERLEQIFAEREAGNVGQLATAAEVLACLYPATMDAPLHRDWVRVYLWAGNQVFVRHNRLAEGQTFWESIGERNPVEFSSIESDYRQLATQLRERAIAESKPRGWGARRTG